VFLFLLEKSGIDETEIIEVGDRKLNAPLIILGFAGPGLVGGIAVSHIIEKLGLKQIAHVRSKYIPPAVVFFNGKLKHPFRIYSDEKGELCVVVCELPLRSDGAFQIGVRLVDWAEENGAKEIAVLDGFPVKNMPRERKSYCAAEPEKRKKCKEKGIDMVTAGIIGGIAGSILNECLTRNIIGVAYLTPAVSFMPDPNGAASLIETVNLLYGLNVETKELVDKAEEIKKKLNEVVQKQMKMKKAEEKSGLPESFYV
jgi:uncharacterized protein